LLTERLRVPQRGVGLFVPRVLEPVLQIAVRRGLNEQDDAR
jgi:hypothetical protein